MIAVVFQFEVKPGQEDEFERLHGADGEWTSLSRQSRSFIGSSFLREFAAPPRYLLIEYWSEMVVYERHLKDLANDIDALDLRRGDLVDHDPVARDLQRAGRAGPLRPRLVAARRALSGESPGRLTPRGYRFTTKATVARVFAHCSRTSPPPAVSSMPISNCSIGRIDRRDRHRDAPEVLRLLVHACPTGPSAC